MKTLAPHIRLAGMSNDELDTLKRKLQERLFIANASRSWITSNPSKCVDVLDSIGWQAHARMVEEIATKQTNLYSDICEITQEIENREKERVLQARYDHDLPPQCADCGQYSCVCEAGPCFLTDEEDFDF